MRMKQLFLLLLGSAMGLAIFASPSFGLQDETAKAEGMSGSIEKILQAKQEAQRLASDELKEAERIHAGKIDAANQLAIAELTRVAASKIGEGDLPEASKAWDAVLDIDPQNQDATEFFKTIGRLDIIKEKQSQNSRSDRAQKNLSIRRNVFRLDNGSAEFKLDRSKAWVLNETTTFKEEFRTTHTIGILADDGVRYQIHEDMLYGRKTDDKWVCWGRGKWIK